MLFLIFPTILRIILSILWLRLLGTKEEVPSKGLKQDLKQICPVLRCLVPPLPPQCLLATGIQNLNPHSGNGSKLATAGGLRSDFCLTACLLHWTRSSPGLPSPTFSSPLPDHVSCLNFWPLSPRALASSLILAPDHGSQSDSRYSTRSASAGQVRQSPAAFCT